MLAAMVRVYALAIAPVSFPIPSVSNLTQWNYLWIVKGLKVISRA